MKEYVADLYEKIVGEGRGLGKLLSKVPGLDGYMERSRRREADQILRTMIAARLEEVRLQLSNVHHELSRDIIKAMDYAEELGRADTRLMGLIGKIKDAPVGYAGFFDAIKIDAEALARIYAFDEQMLGHLDEIQAQTAALETAVTDNGAIGGAIRALSAALGEANQVFSARNEILMGIA